MFSARVISVFLLCRGARHQLRLRCLFNSTAWARSIVLPATADFSSIIMVMIRDFTAYTCLRLQNDDWTARDCQTVSASDRRQSQHWTGALRTRIVDCLPNIWSVADWIVKDAVICCVCCFIHIRSDVRAYNSMLTLFICDVVLVQPYLMLCILLGHLFRGSREAGRRKVTVLKIKTSFRCIVWRNCFSVQCFSLIMYFMCACSICIVAVLNLPRKSYLCTRSMYRILRLLRNHRSNQSCSYRSVFCGENRDNDFHSFSYSFSFYNIELFPFPIVFLAVLINYPGTLFQTLSSVAFVFTVIFFYPVVSYLSRRDVVMSDFVNIFIIIV